MSLKPTPIQPVPAETARVARAAFPKGNPYLTLRDQLGVIFQDDDFVDSLHVVAPRQRARVACVAELLELHAFDDLTVAHVEAGDDALGQHRYRLGLDT